MSADNGIPVPTHRECRCPFFCALLITFVVILGALGIWFGVCQVRVGPSKGPGVTQRYSKTDLLICSLEAGSGTYYMMTVYEMSKEYTVKCFSLSYLSKYGLRNLHKAMYQSETDTETVIYNYLTTLITRP